MLRSLERCLFAPANARILGVMRIGIGVAAVMELVGSAGRLLALAQPGAVRTPILDPVASVFVSATPVVMVVWLIAGIAFAAGLRTTLAGTVLAVVMFALVTSDAQLYSNHSYLIAFSAFILTFGGAGTALSLDAGRDGSDGGAVPAWTITALRLQLTTMYAFAVIAKLNLSFFSGSVVAASLRRGGLGVPESWIAFEPMFVLSILVICAELFLAIALWHSRWRPAAFVVGLALHGGIVALMHDPWALATFGVATFSLYLAFLEAPRQAYAVVWDDTCGFCGTWVRWFDRLDWLDTLRFVPRSRLAQSGVPVGEAAALEAMHVVGPRGTSRAFRAVTEVASMLPLTFLAAPLLRVPPVARLGERVYARVAARRLCRIGSVAPAAVTDPARP